MTVPVGTSGFVAGRNAWAKDARCISMRDLKKAGKTVEEAIAADPMLDYDAKWSGGLFTTAKWIELLYASVI